MRVSFACLLAFVSLQLVLPTVSHAQDGESEAAEEGNPDAPGLRDNDGVDDAHVDIEIEEEVPTDAERIQALEDDVESLEKRVEQAEKNSMLGDTVSFFGYVDFGAFYPQGSGVGWVQDFGNSIVPDLRGQYGWVFLGDILSTAVNSRGEVADLGDAPGEERFDSVSSKGAPGFLLNEINFGVNVDLGYRVLLTTSVNFVPRTGSAFALGDFFNVDLAQLEWAITEDQNTSIFVGKMDPVIGIEYRDRRADHRFGITPSLIQRYNSGTQLGLKIRSKLFSDWLILAAAVTNGSSTTEQFHFYDEVDSNSGKTGSGRVAVSIPMNILFAGRDADRLEIGVSGEAGPQDRALDNEGIMWFVGADLAYRSVDYALKVEWLKGESPGDDFGDVYSLELKNSGYVELDWMIIPEIGVMLRGGLRDAFVALGTERAYLTKSWRVTVGARYVFNHHILVKAEYLHNGEYGDVPEFGNDIVTSSLILRY